MIPRRNAYILFEIQFLIFFFTFHSVSASNSLLSHDNFSSNNLQIKSRFFKIDPELQI